MTKYYDDAATRHFKHLKEVEAGRVEFIVEPSLGTRWSVDERSIEGRVHYSAHFESEQDAQNFIVNRKLELGIHNG